MTGGTEGAHANKNRKSLLRFQGAIWVLHKRDAQPEAAQRNRSRNKSEKIDRITVVNDLCEKRTLLIHSKLKTICYSMDDGLRNWIVWNLMRLSSNRRWVWAYYVCDGARHSFGDQPICCFSHWLTQMALAEKRNCITSDGAAIETGHIEWQLRMLQLGQHGRRRQRSTMSERYSGFFQWFILRVLIS